MADKPEPASGGRTYAWWLVLALIGLDYFSTLAYLPSVAVDSRHGRSAHEMAPLAALGVVVITLFLALPVYLYVVGRSPQGHGAIGVLERRVCGWIGKFLIVVLLGFVATDFVITRTLSAADASRHILYNSNWKNGVDWLTRNRESVRRSLPTLLQGQFFDFWNEQLVVTLILSVLAFGLYHFLVRGFTPAFLWTAAVVVAVYLALTGIVVGSCLAYLARNPQIFADWMELVRQGAGTPRENTWALVASVSILALLTFPQMALGLSGFELSMTSVGLVRGRPDDYPASPRGRIANSRKMLVVVVLIMGIFLLGSVLSTSLLVPAPAFQNDQQARFRTLAYLAHGGQLIHGVEGSAVSPLFGPWFGTIYDLSTVLILFLAGASVTISLRDLVPPYLARFGMQLQWAEKVGVILHLFNVVILVVTLWFDASVSRQVWAYASSVLVLLSSAAVAAVLEVNRRWKGSRWRPVVLAPFAAICLFFLTMVGLTLKINPSGLTIALIFVGLLLVTGFTSRWVRSTELRFEGFAFANEKTKTRWADICRLEFQVLVPHRPDHLPLPEKDREIRQRHRLGPDVPIIFVEAALGDPSDFYQVPHMDIVTVEGMEVVRVSRCASIAHVIAAIGLAFRECGRPPEIHFGWSEEAPLAANVHFLFFGEGNIPWMVHALLRKAEPDSVRRPRVVIG